MVLLFSICLKMFRAAYRQTVHQDQQTSIFHVSPALKRRNERLAGPSGQSYELNTINSATVTSKEIQKLEYQEAVKAYSE